MPFLLDGNPTQGEISEAINYLLSNFTQSVAADPNTGQVVGPGGEIQYYLYKYMFVKYADSFDGSVGFSNTPTNKGYYGLRNSDSTTESTNPADYLWTQVSGGFGTTKFLYYLTTGGRAIQFQVATAVPNAGWSVDPGTPIDLDITTRTNAVANFVVIRLPNNSAAPTDAECVSAIGRTPISGDICTINYNSGITSIVYKYTTGWAIFQKYITGDLIVANSIVGNNIAANTITGNNIVSNSITVNEINNVSVGQIIAGSFNYISYTSVGVTTWTVPAYVYKVKVTVVGGGAGAFNAIAYGGGGGAGGSCIGVFSVIPGTVYTITVGAGGAAGSAGNASSFVGTGINMVANGGQTSVNSGAQRNIGGAGGTASGGQINISGGYGTSTSGAISFPPPCNGGNSIFGGGGGGALGNGNPGSPNSGGGGGGSDTAGTAGAGGSGVVIIEF
jgi:hypothetical protein